ncbi:conserved membrane hypothetical protein [[Clostridium] ultunense Esp]|uniref:PAP2 superfamily protein n=1 Tax=[Clostridium] ultunense Esp TaxID=1288971 RepID=M1ZHK0_9FIRM|nr:hypothetical protein [Schnuerera ultunensis]CCQ97818.1 conserved membrane hypothetical protein [[Clostridium] ultunense Esp]SHD77618.1 conserved membrane protein of unknown function [[Clostridium] ultunense Esp]
MKYKIAKIISLITVVPIIAFFTVLLSFIYGTSYSGGIGWLIYCIAFLTVIPLLAYPVHRIIPAFRTQGRKIERKLAFIFAVVSYVIGSILTFVCGAPILVKKIFMAYLFSGGFLAFINKGLKIKASGHACGVSGPITLLTNLIGLKMLWLFLIMPVIYWSRINLKRHNIRELILGTFVGIFSTLLAVNLF